MEVLGNREILARVRRMLAWGDDALLCVAFVSTSGLHLIRDEARALRGRGSLRLVATTALSPTAPAALTFATTRLRAEVRVLNPGRGTFHSKIYLARKDDQAQALLGSANLTAGLDGRNLEAAVYFDGRLGKTGSAVDDAWSLAETLGDHPSQKAWEPAAETPATGLWDPALLAQVQAVAPQGETVQTLHGAEPNRILRYTPDGVLVETRRSRERGARAAGELVPAEMFSAVWDYLGNAGSVTSKYAQSKDGLRVMRSSFVLALLSRLPQVRVDATYRDPDTKRPGICLRSV